MNPQELEYLQSPEGCDWSEKLRQRQGNSHSHLRWLRKSLTPALAAAVFELSRARNAMRRRHPASEQLFLDTSAASQASSKLIADWRARRFVDCDRLVDLCCGAGLDTLSLAAVANPIGVDCDASRLGFARANARVLKQDIPFVQGLVPDCLGPIQFAFCDPDRRQDDRRIFDPNEASPSLDQLLAMEISEGMAVKLSPMAPLESLHDLGELEFISSQNELKEIVLWTGSLSRGGPRVSLPASEFEYLGEVDLHPQVAPELKGILFEPDPALIRSGLLGSLARDLDLQALSPDIAYLTGNDDPGHPLLRARVVLGTSKTGQKQLQTLIKAHDIGRLDVSRRGYPESPEEIRKRLRLKGSQAGHLHLTRLGGQHVGVLTRPQENS